MVVLVCTGLVSAGSRNVGIAWAENDYLDHMEMLVDWFKKLLALGPVEAARRLTQTYWEEKRYWNPHPPLFKYLGMVARLLWPHSPFPQAERLPSAIAFGLSCAAIFWVLARERRWLASIVGLFALAANPRYLAYGEHCTPDIQVAAAWLLAALAHARFERTRARSDWLLMTGAFAIGLCSKLTLMALLVPLGALTLVWRRREGWRSILQGMAALGAMLAVGLALLVVTYPYLWPAPMERLWGIVQEAGQWAKANPFPTMFFGRKTPYIFLPWYWAPLTIFLVTPPLTLLLSLAGGLSGKPRDQTWALATTHSVFWLLLPIIPSTPKYDNERPILYIFPFIALLAGLGAERVGEQLSKRVAPRTARVGRVVIATAVPLTLTLEVLNVLPFPMSYFSPLVGGPRGAVGLGFEATYAIEVLSPEVLSNFQANLPTGAGLSIHPAADIGPFLQAHGFLRKDIQLSNSSGPFVLLVTRSSAYTAYERAMFAQAKEVAVYAPEGVPLVELWDWGSATPPPWP